MIRRTGVLEDSCFLRSRSYLDSIERAMLQLVQWGGISVRLFAAAAPGVAAAQPVAATAAASKISPRQQDSGAAVVEPIPQRRAGGEKGRVSERRSRGQGAATTFAFGLCYHGFLLFVLVVAESGSILSTTVGSCPALPLGGVGGSTS